MNVFFKRIILLSIIIFPEMTRAQNEMVTKYNAGQLSGRSFLLTDDTNNQFGSIWYKSKIDMSRDTSFLFIMYFGDRDSDGADGMAFVIHNDPRDTIDDPDVVVGYLNGVKITQEGATGDASGGIGYAEHNTSPYWHQKISPSVALEFDTWYSADFQDGAGRSGQPESPFCRQDHVSVIYNGDVYNEQQTIRDANGTEDRILPVKPDYIFNDHNVEDKKAYVFEINWTVNANDQTLELWGMEYAPDFDKNDLRLIATFSDDMLGDVFNGENILRVGFTGATGGSTNTQIVCLWDENAEFKAVDDRFQIQPDQEEILDVLTNDIDDYNSKGKLIVILDPPSHGTAVEDNYFDYSSYKTYNRIKYTPEPGFAGLDTLSYIIWEYPTYHPFVLKDTATVYIQVGETISVQNPLVPKYDAHLLNERCCIITDDADNQLGSAWFKHKINFEKDTSFYLVTYLGSNDLDGADGMAFVIHADPRDTIDDPDVEIGYYNGVMLTQEGAIGDAGTGLGYAIHNSAPYWHQKITPSVAMEFDTWYSNDPQDGAAGDGLPLSPFARKDHVAIVYNGDFSNQQIIKDKYGTEDRILPIKPRYIFGDNHDVEDNKAYIFEIRWIVNANDQTLQLWGSEYNHSYERNGLDLIATLTDDMLGKVFKGKKYLRAGFTGSTGGATNLMAVCHLDENTQYEAVDDTFDAYSNQLVNLNVLKNDVHTYESDHFLKIHKEPAHGIASVVSFYNPEINKTQLSIDYTSDYGFSGKDSLVYISFEDQLAKPFILRDTATVYIEVQGTTTFVTINGQIRTPSSSVVPDAEVTLSIAGNVISTNTNDEGKYTFRVEESTPVKISPHMDTDIREDLTTQDIVLVRSHLLGITPFADPYSYIIADVNGSKSVTVLDIYEMRQVILGIKDQFRHENSVIFINDSLYKGAKTPFDYTSFITRYYNQTTNYQNFTALKPGDVSQGWDPSSSARKSPGSELNLRIGLPTILNNKMSVPVYANSKEALLGMQFSFEFDSKAVRYLGDKNQSLPFIHNTIQKDKGILSMLWDSEDLEGYIPDTDNPVTELEFEILDAHLLPGMKISSALTPAMAVNADMQLVQITNKTNAQPDKDIVVFPVPSSSFISVICKDNHLTYIVTDISGKKVLTGTLKKDKMIDLQSLQSGIYFLNLMDVEGYTYMRKIIRE